MNNYFLELKIRELELLKVDYLLHDNILCIRGERPEIVGCDICFNKKPFATPFGYEIDAGPLVQFSEKFSEYSNQYPEIAHNVWLCPKCTRVFQELIPQIDYLEVQDVSLQDN
jgi:hypothetical protein